VVPLQAVPLWWRRRQPLAVLAIVVAVLVVKLLAGLSINASILAVVIAMYSASVYGQPSGRLVAGCSAIAVTALGMIDFYFNRRVTFAAFVALGPPCLVAWVVGDYFRGRRLYFAGMVDGMQRDREAARQQATEEERLRIARELHDIVAHNVSLMAIQAGAARVSNEVSDGVLQTIETIARETLSELNRLLGVLRKQAGIPALAPQPGLHQVDSLLKAAIDSGLAVTYKVAGQPYPLSPVLDLSAYRIVQESITNVLKHARASRVELTVDYQDNGLVITVSDNGGGPNETPRGSMGHGLIGMRERASLFGGEITAGSSSLGGFMIRAHLPIDEGDLAGKGWAL